MNNNGNHFQISFVQVLVFKRQNFPSLKALELNLFFWKPSINPIDARDSQQTAIMLNHLVF